MKKLFIVSSIIASIAATSAFAKTEGSYVGFDLTRTHNGSRNVNNHLRGVDFKSDNSIGWGVNYKYAKNFNKFFVAPGVFAERLNSKSNDRDGNVVKLNYRYGVRLDLGYDFDQKSAIYITNGLANLHYGARYDSPYAKTHTSDFGYFFGAGVAHDLQKDLRLSLEWNHQKANLKAPSNTNTADRIESTIDVVKLGLAYNF